MDIRVVKSEGKAILVEAVVDGKIIRRIVPPDKITAGSIKQADFDAGIPYGLPLEEILPDFAVCELLETRLIENLHNAGIWTLEDMLHNQRAILGAVQAAYGVDVSAIIQAAQTYKPPKEKQVKEKKPSKETTGG